MESVWSDFKMPRFNKLDGDIKTDVLIIGGGIAGLLTAYELKKRSIDCIIAESDRICRGITENTTAKITSQHGLIYSKLLCNEGAEKAKMYLKANTAALNKYTHLCKNTNSDFEEKDSYVYSKNNISEIERELHALSLIGYNAEFTAKTSLPFPVAGAVKFKKQAQFNPLKFAAKISENLNIYESTPVLSINKSSAKTEKGIINAENIVVTTHFPFINRYGLYFLKMYQERSYVTAINGSIDGMYVDADKSGLSFRSCNDMLLIGSGSHRTGKPTSAWTPAESIARKYYNAEKPIYKWANQDCITLDKIPYIGHYSKNTPHVYVATGFNKWGMTSAMVAADIIADMICGVENDYAPLFSPSRSMLKKQLAINTFESASSLMSFSRPRCPHLGCALKWNKKERSWDCPCHGSRFEKSGRLINNPAVKGIKNPK